MTKWTKTGSVSVIHEFVRDIILNNGYPDREFLTTNVLSFETRSQAETFEWFIVMSISMNRIPSMRSEKMLNVQHRYDEKCFEYENYRGERVMYVNDFPTMYRFVFPDK